MEKLYIISETSQSLSDTAITTVVGDWELQPDTIQLARLMWAAKKAIKDGCRYQFISESEFPPDFDNYSWDYTNHNGFGSSSFYTQSWDDYLTENNII